MAEQPPEPVTLPLFFWAIGGVGTIGALALAWLRNMVMSTDAKLDTVKVELETDISLAKRELWAHNDDHVKGHVRADDIGLLRNWMQAEELRMCDLLEKMEGRIMVEIRTMQAQIHILSTDMAAVKARTERPSLYGRSGDGS